MYKWSETDLLIQEAIRSFIDDEIRPHLDALDDGSQLPYPLIKKFFTSFGVDAMAKEAFSGLIEAQKKKRDNPAPADKKKGGGKSALAEAGGQASMALIACAEFCRVAMGLTTAMGVSLGLTASTIQSRGTIEQQERWLLDLLTFDKVGAWAITEPDAGSDAFGGMRTVAKPDGEGGYILNGGKTFITNGPFADITVVYAKLDDGTIEDRRKQPVLTVVLEKGDPGFTQAAPFRKMGIHSSPTGQIFFDNVKVGADRVLGAAKEEDGRESARSSFSMERMGVAAMALGVIEECQRLCVDYAKSRVLKGVPIGDHQLIQLKLAKMEVARLNVEGMVFRTVELLKDGKFPSLAEASAMKLYSSEAASEVANDAIRLFGGNGYMAEYRVEQLARDAKSLEIYAGSNEIQVTHIAKELLK
ncbi:acyl-CoA dehydrogenase [Pseudonocardiaceae bacterium YIM PH 21723]|nr:acyl-CoA dehydrogenase [Pseudonocardiaceae bacterium YIM PH 21723]